MSALLLCTGSMFSGALTASIVLGRLMKRRKTFQHPGQMELALLFDPARESAPDPLASNGEVAFESVSESSATPPQPGESVLERHQTDETNETGWQAPAPLTTLHEAEVEPESAAPEAGIQEPRLWSDETWTVRVVRNEANDGWAAEISRNGEAEPVLVCPWELDRDKIHPKALDGSAFESLVKAAVDLRRRHERQLQAMLHKSVTVQTRSAIVTITLDIVPDEDDPHALLAAIDESGAQLAKVRVAPGFKLSKRVASAWVDSGYRKAER